MNKKSESPKSGSPMTIKIFPLQNSSPGLSDSWFPGLLYFPHKSVSLKGYEPDKPYFTAAGPVWAGRRPGKGGYLH